MSIVTTRSQELEHSVSPLDDIDKRILRALDEDPRLPVVVLADALGYARRTVQLRLARLEADGFYRPHSTRLLPERLGFTQHAYVSAEVEQARLTAAVRVLADIPYVLHVTAVAGSFDVLCHVVARSSDHLFELGQQILSCPGIRRTTTSLVLRELVPYRTVGLLGG